MKGYFFVLEHPFAVVTKPDGTFEIPNVPAGKQQLVIWQSTKGYVSEGGNKGMTVDRPRRRCRRCRRHQDRQVSESGRADPGTPPGGLGSYCPESGDDRRKGITAWKNRTQGMG